MTDDRQQVPRLRVTLTLAAACAVAVAAVALFAVTFIAPGVSPIWNWLPALLSTTLAGLACRRSGDDPAIDPLTGRAWRHFGLTCAVVLAGLISNAVDVLTSSGDRTHSIQTAVLYVLSALLLLWALLRLPIGLTRQRDPLVRFVLDATIVTVAMGLFAWYFLFRGAHSLDDSLRSSASMIILLLTVLIGALTFVKVAIGGFGGMDRSAVRLLGVGVLVGSLGGALSRLVELPAYLDWAQVSVVATMTCVCFAADRQRRAAGVPPRERDRRPFSIVPYAAVAASDGLLIVESRTGDGATAVIAVAAVGLTLLVVVRQLIALRQNSRLLTRVDANLLELHRYQSELTHRATHDELTNLANRSLFEQESLAALGRGAVGEMLSLALIDLDDFKGINDRLGHAVGDALLVVVADRLRECVRHGDVVARLGGDEFGLLLPGLRSEEATDVLERIAESLTRPVHAAGHDLLVRASIGLAEAWPGASPQELLRRADLAMYAAKERGKGRYAVYDAELEQHQAADAQLGAEMRQGIDRGEFFMVYQPIVRLPDGHWTGVEALVRWQHPDRGLVPPDVFIPIAERTGLIVGLGDWILRTSCQQAADWLNDYGIGAPGEIGVNVSARQLREPGFARDVAQALADAGLAPGRLMVEVTETAVFDGGVALDTLRAVAALGAGVALDDFGTGHSSLGLLLNCPADTLKVDKSFVDDIGSATDEAVIATAMIQITNGLHLQAIAEGVETPEQADTLHRLGYRFAQGFHFSRPLTAEQVGERLDAGDDGRDARVLNDDWYATALEQPHLAPPVEVSPDSLPEPTSRHPGQH